MGVDVDISRQHMNDELALMKPIAVTNRWGLIPDYERLKVVVTMYSHNGDLFIVEATCDDYKSTPPFLEFIDPDTGVRGTRHAYPKQNRDTFFHESGPCICAPFNRKAYKSVVDTGPHGDWNFGDWQTSTANGVQWSNYSKLGDMFGAIYSRISRPDYYIGRMQ